VVSGFNLQKIKIKNKGRRLYMKAL